MKALAPRWNDGPNAAVQQAAIVADLEAAAHEAGAVAASKGKPEEAAAHTTTTWMRSITSHFSPTRRSSP